MRIHDCANPNPPGHNNKPITIKRKQLKDGYNTGKVIGIEELRLFMEQAKDIDFLRVSWNQFDNDVA